MENEIKKERPGKGAHEKNEMRSLETNYITSGGKCQAVSWEIDPGGSKNRVFFHGECIFEGENPHIAKMRYIEALSAHLTPRVKRFCREHELNEIMGCKINLPCWMCEEMGTDTPENACRKVRAP